MIGADFDLAGPIPHGIAVLEASAGTGKTFAIAQLVVRLVAEEGHPIDALLVVTFTQAAAAELRERVRARLRAAVELLEAEPAADLSKIAPDPVLEAWARRTRASSTEALAVRRLRAALGAFDTHRIGTIHGFCQRVLATHAFESGIDFDLTPTDDLGPLLRDAVHDFLASLDARGEPALREREPRRLTIDRMTTIAAAAITEPDAPLLPALPEVDPEASDPRVLGAELEEAWRGSHATIRALFVDAAEAGVLPKSFNLGKPARVRRAVGELDAVFRSAAAGVDRKARESLGSFFKVVEKARDAKKPSPLLAGFASPFFDLVRRWVDASEAYEQVLDAREIRCLHELVAYVRTSVEASKRASRLLSFDDVLRRLERALAGPAGPELLVRIREGLRAALLDEFQDTDPVQWSIFSRIFAGTDRRLLLIGDPKQAIYGFRGADLGTYLRARAAASSRHSLLRNHRSDGALLEALDALYATHPEPFGRSEGEDRIEWVRVSAAKPGSRIERDGEPLVPIQLYGPGVGSEAHEAAATADAIAAVLRSGIRIHKDGVVRPVRPSDCAVLLRTRAVARLQSELRARAIPCVVRSDASVYATDEARELELVLAATLNPIDRRALASALATAIVGASTSRIAALEADEEELEALHAEAQQLEAIWRSRGFASLFRHLLASHRVIERWLGELGGERRVANLVQLGELLHAEGHRRGLGPEALIARLAQLRAEPKVSDDDRRLRLESDDDAVELVTIHRSKGLEWGFVFCVDWTPRKLENETIHVVRDGEGGAALHLGQKDLAPEVFAEIAERAFAEELRLAYVALTRARHALYLGLPATLGRTPFSHLLFHGVEAKSSVPPLVPALVERLAGRMAVADISATRAPSPEPSSSSGLALRTYARTAPLDATWRVSSYTALARTAQRILATSTSDEAAGIAGDPSHWAELEGGAALGTFVHQVLETTHGFDEDALREAATRAEGKLVPRGLDVARLVELTADALRTPLTEGPAPLVLAAIDPGSTLREAPFQLPVIDGLLRRSGEPGVRASDLASVFEAFDRPTMPARYGQRIRGFALDAPLRGFLVGSIDLIVEHEGLLYVIDYKTTTLGPLRDDYARERLPAAMLEHDYLLQALVYALALHRHLARREAGYDYARRFGGVMHLFLRGLHPETGPTHGVYLDRPPYAQIRRLEQVLGIPEAGA